MPKNTYVVVFSFESAISFRWVLEAGSAESELVTAFDKTADLRALR